MALTQEDFGQIGEIVTHAVNGAIGGLATKDDLHSTKSELLSLLATKEDLELGLSSVRGEIRQVRLMLEEDNLAESDRVTRISRRLDRTRAELKQHIASTVHPATP